MGLPEILILIGNWTAGRPSTFATMRSSNFPTTLLYKVTVIGTSAFGGSSPS